MKTLLGGWLFCVALLGGTMPSARAAEGDWDAGFGHAGAIAYGKDDFTGYWSGPLVQADGKFIVCGRGLSDDGTIAPIHVWRFNADGAADLGYGKAGRVELSHPMGCEHMLLQPDGKLLIATYASVGDVFPVTDGETRILRLNATGSPDVSFAGNGVKHVDLVPGDLEGPMSLALAADGIVLLSTAAYPRLALVRLLADGSEDRAFGEQSRVTFDVLPEREGTCCALVDAHGRMLVVSNAKTETVGRTAIAVMRMNRNGEPDASFGRAGRVTIDIPGYSASAATALLQDDGRLLIAGSATSHYAWNTPYANDQTLALRLLDDGTLDGSFGDRGIRRAAVEQVDDGNALINGGVQLPDRSFLFAGAVVGNVAASGLLMKLDANGNPVDAFGPGGMRIFDTPPDRASARIEGFQGIALHGSDYLIVGQIREQNRYAGLVARLDGASPLHPPRSTRPLPPILQYPRIRASHP